MGRRGNEERAAAGAMSGALQSGKRVSSGGGREAWWRGVSPLVAGGDVFARGVAWLGRAAAHLGDGDGGGDGGLEEREEQDGQPARIRLLVDER